MEKRKVGELLVDLGVITEDQLNVALAEQKRVGGRLGRTLIDLGLASEDAISRALASQTGVDHYDLEHTPLEPEAAALVPEEICRRRQLIPIRIEDGTLLVAMANPTDIVATDELERTTELLVRVVSASRRQILQAIDRAYAGETTRNIALEETITRAMAEVKSGEPDARGGGLVALLDQVLLDGIRRDATDIHFEPDEKVVRTRLRIDGDLVQTATLPGELISPLVARVKVLAHLNIAETRVPQDGKIRFPVDRRKVDLRISTFPSVYGESVVIRVLDTGGTQFSLSNLGLDERAVDLLQRAAQFNNGLVLAAGPTGSGKTTTLYATLRAVNSAQRKVITLEDPVEYGLPLVTQCQINEKAGLTFAAGLRSILRHDPDVILVGEMRDAETASMAVRAALTGHLVLSTIHTNDSVRTISRLRDMGVEQFLVASCLSLIVAQRLVRVICEYCHYEYEPTPEELEAVGLPPKTEGSFAQGKGCARCNQTGIHGREALFEVLEITPDLSCRISRGDPIDKLESAARETGMRTFRDSAQHKARAGRITLAEVARVTSEH